MAHIRQSWPDSVIGFQVKVLNIVYAVCSLFARKRVALRSTSVSPLELFPRRSEAIRPTLPNNKRQKWVYTFVIRSRDEPCPIKEAWMPSKSLGRGIHTSSLGTSHTIFLLLSATRVTGASAVGCGVNRSLKPLEVFPRGASNTPHSRGASHAIPPNSCFFSRAADVPGGADGAAGYDQDPLVAHLEVPETPYPEYLKST